MTVYTQFISKFRKPLIIILILINIISIVGLTRININADFNIFQISDSKYQVILDDMADHFGSNNQTILLVKANDTLEATINDVNQILSKSGINYTSPLDTLNFLGLDLNTFSESDLSPITIYEEDHYITYLLNTEQSYNFDSLIESIDTLDLDYYFAGDHYMQYEIIRLIFSVLTRIPPLALLLVLLVFRSQLSSFKAALLSVLPAGLGALWTMGLIGWMGGDVSIITVLAPIFAIVIGSADGLHFVTHMEEEMTKQSPTDALNHTLKIVGVPMIITTTTSMAGFIGLMMINTDAIKDLALFASVGVFLAGVITWYVLPLIFTGSIKLKHSPKGHGKSFTALWGRKSIIIAIVLVLTSLIFIPSIQTEFNQLLFFKDSTNVQKNFKQIMAVNDGAVPLYFYGHTDLVSVEEKLPELQDVFSTLESNENVTKVIYPKFDNFEGFSLKNLSQAKQFIHVSGDQLYYRFMVFPKDLKNDTISSLKEATEPFDEQGQLIGVQFLMQELNETLVKGQVLSIIVTMLLIIIMLFIALRSIKLTLVATIPILLTSIILYGFLGLSGISLNLMTSTIFSITLGIGIDYAIHYTSVFQYYRKNNHEHPVEQALLYSSRPIIANALGLSLGLSALWLSPLLIHLHISILMWVAMLVAVFMSLTVLPTLLKKVIKS